MRHAFNADAIASVRSRDTGTVTITDESPTQARFEFELRAQGSIPFQTFTVTPAATSAIRVSADFVVDVPAWR